MNTAFENYHARNPKIYEAFKKITFEALERKFTRLSSDFIFHIIRWTTDVSAEGERFKISNNMTPFYARKFMQDFPEYAGFFRTKASKADLN